MMELPELNSLINEKLVERLGRTSSTDFVRLNRPDQGDLKVGLHLEALEGAGVHERAEELVPGLAGGLGGVHRGVGVPDHLVGVRLPRDAERDPDRRSHEQFASSDLERD